MIWAVARAGVMRIFWTTIAVVFDGLFWSLVLAVADLLTFLGQLLYRFHGVGRPVGQDTQQIPAASPAVGPLKNEDTTVAFKEEISQSHVEIPPSTARAPHVKVTHRRSATDHRVGAPQTGNIMPQHSLPVIACNVACHNTWRQFYAVVIGREPGIYKCWDCAKLEVDRYSGHLQKSFAKKIEAEAWFCLQWHCSQYHLYSHNVSQKVHRIISRGTM